MTPVLLYLLKLSISLSVVFLFYHFVLRRLTFYNWNRVYLVLYSVLSFFIPFIDISLVLENNQWHETGIVQWVPAFENTVIPETATATTSLSLTGIIQVVIISGITLMLFRLLIQLFSFRRLMSRASFIPVDGMKLYQVDEPIIPFSFGNSIFINRSLHNDTELSEIILHEFVHVKQKHSIDIIFSELLCLLNWYNPFAWLIRSAIRQNLEFIADNQVLQNGIDKKQYQYLLLKVIGNNHFSIAPKFNFSSLKKRIAMMNKMKSAGVHLVKFLFILPLVAVLLLAFRNQYRLEEQFDDSLPEKVNTTAVIPVIRIDTVPAVTVSNSKGYYIDVIGVNGECTVVVKDKNGRQVEKVMLNEWKEDGKYEEKYGEILPPPPARPAVPAKPDLPSEPSLTTEPTAPTPPAIPAKPTSVGCGTGLGIATVALADAVTVSGYNYNLRGIATSYEITDQLATIKLKDGTTEKYDLKKPEDKAKFESKYGKIITTASGSGDNPVVVAGSQLGTTIAATKPGTAILVDEDYVYNISGDEDVLVRITPNTKKEELDKFISQMKQRGIDLSFNEIEYDSKGKLILISGRMKSNDGVSNFVANDFEVLILAMIKKKDKTLFTVSTKEQREPI